jgi:regulator of protease activity HflC (stomatin/prohibitin superfamily)
MTALLALPLLTFAVMALSGVRRVPQGQAWTVRRFGRYVRTLRPGTRFVWPLLDRIARQVVLIGHHVEVPTQAFGTSHASADLYYQILDPMPSGDGLESVDDMVLHQADDALASVAAQLPHSSGWTASTADALKIELNRRLDRTGLRIIRCALHSS